MLFLPQMQSIEFRINSQTGQRGNNWCGCCFFFLCTLAYQQPVTPSSLPRVTVSGRNSVTIGTPSLSGGDVSSFTSWEIQWRSVGGEWQTATIPTSSSSYTIPGELASGVYDIRVRATSASGNSLYTWPVQIFLLALPTVCKYCTEWHDVLVTSQAWFQSTHTDQWPA